MFKFWIYKLIWNQWNWQHQYQDHGLLQASRFAFIASIVSGAIALLHFLWPMPLSFYSSSYSSSPTMVTTLLVTLVLTLAGISGSLLLGVQISVVGPRAKVLFAKLAQIKQARLIAIAVIKSPSLNYESVGSELNADRIKRTIDQQLVAALMYLGICSTTGQIRTVEGEILDLITGQHWKQLYAKERLDLILRVHINEWANPPNRASVTTCDIRLINAQMSVHAIVSSKERWHFYGDGHQTPIAIAEMILMDLISPSELKNLTTCEATN